MDAENHHEHTAPNSDTFERVPTYLLRAVVSGYVETCSVARLRHLYNRAAFLLELDYRRALFLLEVGSGADFINAAYGTVAQHGTIIKELTETEAVRRWGEMGPTILHGDVEHD